MTTTTTRIRTRPMKPLLTLSLCLIIPFIHVIFTSEASAPDDSLPPDSNNYVLSAISPGGNSLLLLKFDPGHDLESHYSLITPHNSNNKLSKSRLKRQSPSLPNITAEDVNESLLKAEEIIQRRFTIVEPQLYKNGSYNRPGSPPWYMSISHRANQLTKNLSRISLLSEEATRLIAQKYTLTREQIAYSLPNLDIRNTLLNAQCPAKVDFPCQPRKYRAYNGYCNNVQHPRWGSANTRYLRYLMPNYADGVGFAKRAEDGNYLPSARYVSLGIHKDSDRPHEHLMALTALWGEFVAHDISHTPQSSGFAGSSIKCCGIDIQNVHEDCYRIRINNKDPVYGNKFGGDGCQEYVRSAVAPRIGCTLGPREQINQASSFLDASHIYGTFKKRTDELRLFKNGLLKTQVGPGGELLPASTDNLACRLSDAGGFRCFKSGDERVNEHVGMASLHTLWLREHNRIARELFQLNSHWSDEILFQESRRIVIAEIQHITYSEFLPVVLGQYVVTGYGLKPLSSGFYQEYNTNTNPGVLNGVASAALWFFASLMPKSMPFYDAAGRKVDEKGIGDSFYAPFDLYRNGVLDQILRGLLRGKAQKEDQFINDVMTNRMFEDPNTGVGLDLAAQLIQQGRDHGIPGYIFYRELCGLGSIRTFSDLNRTMADDVILSLQRLYEAPEDIDLFTGGLAEFPQEGAVVGPTFGCLLGIQFQKLRRGDRFWYENDLPPSSFTSEQLQEIRKVTLARVICDNSNAMMEVQPSVLLDRDPFLNAPMHCEGSAIRRLNLKKWLTEAPPPPPSSSSSSSSSPNFPTSKLKDAIQKARDDISNFHTREKNLWKQSGKAVDPQSPAGTASGFNKPKAQALEIANTSFLLQFATSRFINEFLSLSGELQDSEISPADSSSATRDVRELLSTLPEVQVSALTQLPQNLKCGEHNLPCDHTSIFRSITGWCNNLRDPNKGKAFSVFKRLLPATYNDGFQEPRILSKNRVPLPSARLVSTEVHDDISVPHQRYTLLLMQYAQLLDHDLTHTPMNRGFDNSILDCHSCDAKVSVHPECWPIPVPPRDPHFPAFNATSGSPVCLLFTRSLPGQLTLGYREQLNQVTSFLDASIVYGSDVCEASKLRLFEGGQMNMTSHPGGKHLKGLLPQTPSHPECKAPSGLCFEAGDLRASEQPALAAIHTIWLREHNRLASSLQSLNPHWNDELLYQHSRRILSAMTQHVTYAEFLPRILGWDNTHKYALELSSSDGGGYFEGYDDTCDSSIINEFATGAFRFGHSLLKPAFKRLSADLRIREPSVQLRNTFFNPDLLLREGMIDELLLGLANTPMETLDNFITEEVTNHLFEDRRVGPVSGMDLAALNIQRGRDHGLPGYNEYRALCNLTRARSFEDLRGEIPPRLIQKLKRIYQSVDDIDLFPGGLAEISVHGGLVGPTFACIIGKQFQLLRTCDRFWYENSQPLTRFTPAQLEEIRKTSLAKIICDNGDDVRSIQRAALDVPEPFLNPRVPCNSLPRLDLSHWKDRVDCQFKGKAIPVGVSERVSPCVMCTCTKEGPLCASMKIDNCIRLSRSYETNEILEDHVCKVQCAFAFRLIPFAFNNNNITNSNTLR